MLNPLATRPLEEELLQAQVLGGAGAQVPGGPAVAQDASGQPAVVPYTSRTEKDASTDSGHAETSVIKTPEIAQAEAGLDTAYNKQIAAREAQKGADIAKEAIESDAAGKEVDVRSPYQAERDDLKKATDDRIAALMKEQADLREEMKRNGPESYVDDMGSARRFLSAIAIGLGAYASGINGGPNQALEVYKLQEQAFQKKREARLEAQAKRLLATTGDIKAANELMTSGLADIKNREIASLDYLKSQTEALKKRVPEAATRADAAIADIEKEKAAKGLEQADLFKKSVTDESKTHGPETSVTTVEGSKAPTQGQPQRETVNEISATEMQIKGLKEREDIIKRNPKAWLAYRDAIKATDEADILKQTGLGKAVLVGQGFGVSAKAADERLQEIKDPKVRADAKRLNQLEPIVQTGQARIMDPVGVLNESSQMAARKSLNIYTASPEEAINIGKQFQGQFENRLGMLRPKNPAQPPQATPAASAAPAPNPAATPKPAPKAAASAPAQKKAPRFTEQQSADYDRLVQLRRKYAKDPEKLQRIEASMADLRRAVEGK